MRHALLSKLYLFYELKTSQNKILPMLNNYLIANVGMSASVASAGPGAMSDKLNQARAVPVRVKKK